MKILIASKNSHKIKEIKEIVSHNNLDIEIISLSDLNDQDEVEETGSSFSENSEIKALFYAKKYNMNVLADDSGLCVDALNGAPGIYSARFSGLGDNDNNKKLLRMMINEDNRSAKFVCDMCLILDNKIYHFVGQCAGSIARNPNGENGFGYDPLFMVNLNNKEQSFASIDGEEKNKISHRGKALDKFANFLTDFIA